MSAFLVLLGALELTAPQCPSAEEVAARWAALGVETLAGQAQVSVDGDRLRIVLTGSDGSVRADRQLRVPPSCSERAAIAAVVLAAWASPAAAASPHLTPTERAPSAAPLSAQPAPPRRRTLTEITAAFVGDVDSSGFAPSGSLDLSLIDSRSGWGGHLSFVGGGARSLPIGDQSHAGYARFPFSLGPRRRFSPSRAMHLHIDLSAEASFALVYVKGQGFAINESGYSFAFGLGTGLRVGWGIGAWTPFIGVSLLGWVTRTELIVGNAGGRAQLPPIDGLFSAGISFEP